MGFWHCNLSDTQLNTQSLLFCHPPAADSGQFRPRFYENRRESKRGRHRNRNHSKKQQWLKPQSLKVSACSLQRLGGCSGQGLGLVVGFVCRSRLYGVRLHGTVGFGISNLHCEAMGAPHGTSSSVSLPRNWDGVLLSPPCAYKHRT